MPRARRSGPQEYPARLAKQSPALRGRWGRLHGTALVYGGLAAMAAWAVGRRAWLRRRAQRQIRRAGRGEQLLARVLEAQGFAITAWRPHRTLLWRVDGRRLPMELKAEARAVREGRSYLVLRRKAEAGALTTEERRELAGLLLAFRVGGAYLTDQQGEQTSRVELYPGRAFWMARGGELLGHLCSFALGGGVVYLLARGGYF